MINYIEMINRYWQEVDVKGFTPTETNIYFRLLDICNRLGWKNPFSLSNPRAVALMAVSENTLAAGREKLVMRGLIGFKKGARRKDAPQYCFPELIDGEWVFPDSFTSNIDTKIEVNEVFTSNIDTKIEVIEDFAADFTSNIEPKVEANEVFTSNIDTKLGDINKTINNDVIVDTTTQPTLDFGKEKKTKRKPRTKEPPIPPTLEEVLDYFKTHAENRLQDWRTSGTLFFDTFNADGWVNKYGRHIQNWDSEANKWIYYQEQREKANNSNETKQTDRFSERRGTEPNATSRKGFKGTF